MRFSATAASAFTMMVFAALLGMNALLHLGLSLASGSAIPGLLTALLVTLPTSMLVLARAGREAWVSRATYWAVLPTAALPHGPGLIVLLGTVQRMMRA